MSAVAPETTGAQLWLRWRDRAAWVTTSDVFLILVATALPWSTSLTAVFTVAAIVTMAPFFDANAFLQSVKRPVSIVPMALFVLALAGTLWSDAPWGARLYAVGPIAKLLMLPLLFYHFERSTRGVQVFAAFLVSCIALMAMSWLVAYDPRFALKAGAEYGVAVKNYIDQSQEFALCAVVLAYPVIVMLRARRTWLAAMFIAISVSFVFNMLFVSISRTALVTIPVMLAVFGLLHLRWRTNLMILSLMIGAVVVAWTVSPKLEGTVKSFKRDYQLYMERGTSTSIGERLEFWKKSAGFIAEAPIIGHGTGSTNGLFEQAAAHAPAVLAAGKVVSNPHNQTLAVAIQWGVPGILILYAMWWLHLSLFRGEGLMAWIGLMVVVQNFFTSLFNSHIFDFNEGWMYVLGVGIAGGTLPRPPLRETPASTSNSVDP
ncbi:MAG TPA: O-antigen ligase family protein [Bradyrhizobium sp.]|nr:O-antigen ligase family protein [Bradyrhizobium sp.]